MHRLFFAVRPDLEAGSQAIAVAQRFMRAHGLSGHPLPLERLHVTLHWLGDHEELPDELLRKARDAGARVEAEPFGVGFDRIGSLGDARMGGLALTGAAELKMLRGFQRVLAETMVDSGIGQHVRHRFNPHVSLRYSPPHVPRQPIEPIRWRVEELVLIESLLPRHARRSGEVAAAKPSDTAFRWVT